MQLPDNELAWIHSAYGKPAACLSEITIDIRQTQAVEHFYHTLGKNPEARAILSHLSESEFAHLQQAQIDYLITTLSPDITFEQHTAMAFQAGLRHFYVGLSIEMLTESMGFYGDVIQTLIQDTPHPDNIASIITRRLQYDLIVQIKAYSRVEEDRLRAFQELTELQSQSLTQQEYLIEALNILFGKFSEELTGIAVGQVNDKHYQHLQFKGQLPFLPESGTAPPPVIQIAEIQQLWFDEASLLLNNLHSPCRLPDTMLAECRQYGLRSLGMILMHDNHHIPDGFLMIGGRFPGYFINQNTQHYWQEIADLICHAYLAAEQSPPQPKIVTETQPVNQDIYFRQLLSQHQVEMFYQPIIHPATGDTVKVEALARLKNDDQIIAPGLFLPSLGARQLRDLFEIGLEQIAQHSHETFMRYSINLPTEIIADTAWLQGLPHKLEQLGIDKNVLSLEILESSLTDNPAIKQVLFELQEAGYAILLDDVGAGESSLLRLAHLPVNGIKIDQSFTRSLQYNFENLDFIISLRALALQRGLECIVEGVETTDIMDTLGHMDELYQQGYAFAKPLSHQALSQWLSRDKEGQPLGPFPQTLYGWYGRHVERFLSARQALSAIPDLLSVEQLHNAEQCPLHAIIPDIGGDDEIIEAHYRWHQQFAHFARLRKQGESMHTLWPAMENSKYELRKLIERKLYHS